MSKKSKKNEKNYLDFIPVKNPFAVKLYVL